MLSLPCGVREGRCILCLPLQVTADGAASPEESPFRSVKKASCFFERAASKVIWDKRPPCERGGVFTTSSLQTHLSPLFWTAGIIQNKMGGDCVFSKSCSWMWWLPLKPCQRDVFILFLFSLKSFPLVSPPTRTHAPASCAISKWLPSQLTKDKAYSMQIALME